MSRDRWVAKTAKSYATVRLTKAQLWALMTGLEQAGIHGDRMDREAGFGSERDAQVADRALEILRGAWAAMDAGHTGRVV